VADLFAWLQSTLVASTIAQSQILTAALSAVHVVGLALVVGSAFVTALALTGLAFPSRSAAEIATAGRAVLIGLAISMVTGVLLFSARAEAASQNSFFQLKMLLVVSAALCQLVIQGVARRALTSRAAPVAGVLGLALWVSVVLAGCAFILLE
jgi:hypothetical protein